MEDVLKVLAKLQQPVRSKNSTCGFFGVSFGFLLMFISFLFTVILLVIPDALVPETISDDYFIRTDVINLISLDTYIADDVDSIILDLREHEIYNETFINETLTPYYNKANSNDVSLYLYVYPEDADIINHEYKQFKFNGMFVDSEESIENAFIAVNEYKIKVSPNYLLGTFNWFNSSVDRYYYDVVMYQTNSTDVDEVYKLLTKEMLKGKSLVGFDPDYYADRSAMTQVINYIHTFCEQETNYVGFVVIE
ncbi:Uncharacterized protein QTN25_002748 [Entamoeba marina]